MLRVISVTFARDSRSSKTSARAELLSFNVPTVDLSYSVLSIDSAALPARTTTGMTKRQNRDARRENIPDVNSEVHSSNPLCSTRKSAQTALGSRRPQSLDYLVR
jgi:hypothetical protein